MNRTKLSSNIAYNLAYQILVLIVPLVTAPYISRTLGVDGVGTFSYVSSVAYYFYIIILLGLNNYGNRAIAKCGDDDRRRSKTFWSIYLMQLIIGVITVIIYLLFAGFIADVRYKDFFLIYSLYVMAAAIDINWFYFGIKQFKLTTIRSTVIKVLSLLIILFFVRGEYALYIYMLTVAGSTMLSSIILWAQIRKYISFYMPNPSEVYVHLKPNLILFIPILAMSIYRVMDKIMIKELSGITQNGYYENADRIISISLTVFSAVATVMMPTISTMIAEGKEEIIKRLFRDMMQITSLLSVAMVLGLFAIADKFAPLFFGEQFIETGYLLRWLSLTIFLSGWKNVLRSQYLIPYEKDKVYVLSLVLGAVINLIMNYIFIPRMGARGAVIGTLCAELTGFIIQTYVVSKKYSISELIIDAVIFIPAGIVMAVIAKIELYYLPYSILSVGFVIIVSGIIYGIIALILLKVFANKRYAHLKSLISKRRLS